MSPAHPFPLICVLASFAPFGLAADATELFEMKVRPLLAKNCFACHTASRMGNLEMASREALLKGGNSGPAVIPGDPEKSLLIQAVSYSHARLRMPPQSRLQPEEVAVLRDWIKAGAIWPDSRQQTPQDKGFHITPEQRAFWSFQPVKKPAIPEVRNKAWIRNPIDAFILSRLEKEGLQPAHSAPKRVLLRRLFLDLIGLPPSPDEVFAFEKDRSPDALAKVVDRLLASPHYGERWGRHWLDVARYTDDKLNIVADEPYPNSFRYRDWVIQAFNQDMPYDLFVKAQVAADLLPVENRERLMPGLGFYGMSAQYQEDRPDATGKAFLGLTVGCAQCHDHKFDPIPTKDYYALLGVFHSTKLKEHPLAPESVVSEYQKREKEIEELQKALSRFREQQARQLAEILATRIDRYLPAAWKVIGPQELAAEQVAATDGLDLETLRRWIRYLKRKDHEHPHLKAWNDLLARGGDLEEARRVAAEFQAVVLQVHKEIREIEEKNLATLGGAEGNPALAKIVLLPYPRDKYVFWAGLFGESRTGFSAKKDDRVIYYSGDKVDRFLHGEWKSYVEELTVALAAKKKSLPEKYPFLHAIEDIERPENMKVHVRGNPENLGEEAPRAFLSILSEGPPKPFRQGSGRLELAEAIACATNPLTARVMVNRIWTHHFGAGIVRTPSNFGQLGERATHPELLDYLVARFVENGWSIQGLHREIVLSATYALSSENIEKNARLDAGNRLLWRANVRRLDIEVVRDSMLAVSGQLDETIGGPPLDIADAKNHRRTVYSFVSRRKLNATLAMFDFPNANDTSEQRLETTTPLQRLFFLNSDFVIRQAERFAERLARYAPAGGAARVRLAYRLALGRDPSAKELQWGKEFVSEGGDSWARYAQVLLASNEFLYVN
jgi:mono/diheme cytochrome c family protein